MAFSDNNRSLQFTLKVKWDGTNWTDETSYLVNASGSERAPVLWKALSANNRWLYHTANFVMRNADRYDKDNAASPVGNDYGHGAEIELSISADGGATWQTGFYGKIDTIALSSVSRDEVVIAATDMSQPALQAKRSSTLQTDVKVQAWIVYLAGLAGLPVAYEGGEETIPYAWLDDENVMDEIAAVAQAGGGVAFMSRTGIVTFYGLQAFVTKSELTTPQMTLTLDNERELQRQLGWENVYNGIIAQYTPFAERTGQTLYSLNQPFSLNAGESKTIRARYRYPALSVDAAADYTILTGGGEDISSSVTITRTDYAQRSDIIFANNHAYKTANILRYVLTGNALIGRPSEKYITEATSPVIGDPSSRKKTLPVRGNAYLQSNLQAQLLADPLLARLLNMRATYRVTGLMRPDIPLYSRVSVYVKTSGATVEAFWTGTDWRLDENGYTATYELTGADGWFPNHPSPGYFDISSDKVSDGKVIFY